MKFFFFVNSKNQPVVQGSSGRLVSGKSQLSIPIKEASATGIGEGGGEMGGTHNGGSGRGELLRCALHTIPLMTFFPSFSRLSPVCALFVLCFALCFALCTALCGPAPSFLISVSCRV